MTDESSVIDVHKLTFRMSHGSKPPTEEEAAALRRCIRRILTPAWYDTYLTLELYRDHDFMSALVKAKSEGRRFARFEVKVEIE